MTVSAEFVALDAFNISFVESDLRKRLPNLSILHTKQLITFATAGGGMLTAISTLRKLSEDRLLRINDLFRRWLDNRTLLEFYERWFEDNNFSCDEVHAVPHAHSSDNRVLFYFYGSSCFCLKNYWILSLFYHRFTNSIIFITQNIKYNYIHIVMSGLTFGIEMFARCAHGAERVPCCKLFRPTNMMIRGRCFLLKPLHQHVPNYHGQLSVTLRPLPSWLVSPDGYQVTFLPGTGSSALPQFVNPELMCTGIVQKFPYTRH